MTMSSNKCRSVPAFCMIVATALHAAGGALESPCPGIFEYRYDGANELYGFIQVPSLDGFSNVIRLAVQLSVGNPVQGFNGKIELASVRSRIIDDILRKKPLMYKVLFPFWNKIPPAITRISVNENPICLGYPIDRSIVPVLTTINLQHTLTITIPGRQQPSFAPGGFSGEDPFEEAKPTIYQFVPPESDHSPPINFNPMRDPPKNRRHDFWQRPQTYPAYSNSDARYTPGFASNPFLSYPNAKPAGEYPPTPSKFGPHDYYPQFDHDVKPSTTTTPRTPPTLAPKESDPEDLPTVESNLVQEPFSSVCGISVKANELLVNGNRVGKGAHPWLAALFMQNNEGLKFQCGSTLVSQRHVVTAAHCVQNRRKRFRPEELWVVLGRENIQRWSNDGAQIIQAQSTHVHPNYRFNTADADAAVIALTEDVVFSSLIRPACLWTSDSNPKLVVEKKGTVVGWGKDESGKLFSSQPKQIELPIVSEETCLRSNPAFRDITSNRTFCAGYRNNSGPCNGDSGSGFLIRKGGRWTLRGVVSMSLLRESDGSCDLSQYVVFTDVAQYMDWLLDILR